MLSIYPACFFKEADNKYSVIFPDLNWLSTCGDSIEDALSMAVDCLAGYLYTCKKITKMSPRLPLLRIFHWTQLQRNFS